MNDLEIISLTKSNLREAIAENKYWAGTYQPAFSKNKAKGMLEKTRANDDDVLAVLGYEKHTIIAFIYFVPDLVKNEDGNLIKVFWSQRWWVSDKYKETVLSTYIKNLSLNACNNQAIIKFLGDKTKAYYKKQPFTEFSKRKRYIIIFSLDSQLLIYRKASLKFFKPLLKLLDSFSRRIVAIVNNIKTNKKGKHITSKQISEIDVDAWNFIEKNSSTDIVPKSKEFINWQISNNQYHNLAVEKEPDYKCLLGTIAKKIYNSNFVIRSENEIVGFVSGFVSGNRFIIRYFISNETYYDDCLNVLIKGLIDSKCTLLQTENSELGDNIINKYFKVYADVKELVSLVHNDVDINLQNAVVTDQDGNFF